MSMDDFRHELTMMRLKQEEMQASWNLKFGQMESEIRKLKRMLEQKEQKEGKDCRLHDSLKDDAKQRRTMDSLKKQTRSMDSLKDDAKQTGSGVADSQSLKDDTKQTRSAANSRLPPPPHLQKEGKKVEVITTRKRKADQRNVFNEQQIVIPNTPSDDDEFTFDFLDNETIQDEGTKLPIAPAKGTPIAPLSESISTTVELEPPSKRQKHDTIPHTITLPFDECFRRSIGELCSYPFPSIEAYLNRAEQLTRELWTKGSQSVCNTVKELLVNAVSDQNVKVYLVINVVIIFQYTSPPRINLVYQLFQSLYISLYQKSNLSGKSILQFATALGLISELGVDDGANPNLLMKPKFNLEESLFDLCVSLASNSARIGSYSIITAILAANPKIYQKRRDNELMICLLNALLKASPRKKNRCFFYVAKIRNQFEFIISIDKIIENVLNKLQGHFNPESEKELFTSKEIQQFRIIEIIASTNSWDFTYNQLIIPLWKNIRHFHSLKNKNMHFVIVAVGICAFRGRFFKLKRSRYKTNDGIQALKDKISFIAIENHEDFSTQIQYCARWALIRLGEHPSAHQEWMNAQTPQKWMETVPWFMSSVLLTPFLQNA